MGWISVNDKLPNEFETVLIYNNKSSHNSTKIITALFHLQLFKEIDLDSEREYTVRKGYFLPTHWMPLPPPPTTPIKQ